MAILHNKEFKIASVIEKLPKKYTEDQFVEQFIKLFSKEWGKIKTAYIKQSQDKEPGTVINMPKPDLYLKQLLKNFLRREDEKAIEPKDVEPVKIEEQEEIVPQKVVRKAKSEKKEDVEIQQEEKTEIKKPKKDAAEKKSKLKN
ncbi:hypothetical protein ABIB40_003250 [Pedobacter sp. UYP30]|uniref:hypothetical protein n=1 Tax=Pedobacter sp. UYP30 TaxID=1756400 RepID=UPI003396E830